jgi:hypothetical protein
MRSVGGTAHLVRRIFRLSTDGVGTYSIVKTLNRDGILDRADSTSYSVHGAKDHEIDIFELETVERTSRCLLRVAFNWHPRRAADSKAS